MPGEGKKNTRPPNKKERKKFLKEYEDEKKDPEKIHKRIREILKRAPAEMLSRMKDEHMLAAVAEFVQRDGIVRHADWFRDEVKEMNKGTTSS